MFFRKRIKAAAEEAVQQTRAARAAYEEARAANERAEAANHETARTYREMTDMMRAELARRKAAR